MNSLSNLCYCDFLAQSLFKVEARLCRCSLKVPSSGQVVLLRYKDRHDYACRGGRTAHLCRLVLALQYSDKRIA